MSETPNVVEIGGFVVALGTLIAGIFQYLNTRQRELAWKRTEFVFAQCQYAENDPEIKEVVDILAGRSSVEIEDVLSATSSLTAPERWRLERSLEKLLGLLDRLAYAVDYGKSLTLSEIAEFGWHFRVAATTPIVRELCTASYPCLLAVAPRLQGFIDITWPSAMPIRPLESDS